MAFNKRETEVDMDQIAAFLQDAVEKVKTQENPDLLNDLKKVFKKNVPLTLRGYVAAYLAKQAGSHYRPRREFNNDRNHRDFRNKQVNNRAPRAEAQTSAPAAENTEFTPRQRVQIDPALAATIFIGIGRNRRVYPRDLVGLLVSVAGLDRDRIGDIRVLANYSFVQLFTEDAEGAIAKLNGYDYRGRKLSVNYTRLKEDGAADSSEAEATPDGYTESDAQADAQAYAAAEKAASNQEGFSSGSAVASDSSYNA